MCLFNRKPTESDVADVPNRYRLVTNGKEFAVERKEWIGWRPAQSLTIYRRHQGLIRSHLWIQPRHNLKIYKNNDCELRDDLNDEILLELAKEAAQIDMEKLIKREQREMRVRMHGIQVV